MGRLFLLLGGFVAGVVAVLATMAFTMPERVATLIERTQAAIALQLLCEPEDSAHRLCLWVRPSGRP
jgi:hypothetical protein